MSVSCPRNSLSVMGRLQAQSHNFAPQQTHACFPPSCRPTMKKSSPCTKSFWKNGTEMPRLGKTFQSARLERNALATVGLRPGIRTLCFAISNTRLAVLLWGSRLVVERGHHAPHQRGSELDSRLRLRSGTGLQFEKCLPDKQHKAELEEFPAEVLPRRSVRPLSGALPYTPNASGNVGLWHCLCWYQST